MKAIIVLSIFLFQSVVFANGNSLKPEDRRALQQTQRLLKNKSQRNKYINENQPAKDADNNVNNLTGGNAADSQEIYSIAADVMSLVSEKAKKPNGEVDVEKMKQLVNEYQSNPEAFYRQMTPEQRRRIKALGKKIGPAPASQN